VIDVVHGYRAERREGSRPRLGDLRCARPRRPSAAVTRRPASPRRL